MRGLPFQPPPLGLSWLGTQTNPHVALGLLLLQPTVCGARDGRHPHHCLFQPVCRNSGPMRLAQKVWRGGSRLAHVAPTALFPKGPERVTVQVVSACVVGGAHLRALVLGQLH